MSERIPLSSISHRKEDISILNFPFNAMISTLVILSRPPEYQLQCQLQLPCSYVPHPQIHRLHLAQNRNQRRVDQECHVLEYCEQS